jgi:hypothetical protein
LSTPRLSHATPSLRRCHTVADPRLPVSPMVPQPSSPSAIAILPDFTKLSSTPYPLLVVLSVIRETIGIESSEDGDDSSRTMTLRNQ